MDEIKKADDSQISNSIFRSRDFDSLGDHCKDFEKVETDRKARQNKILMARLDGRAFHTLTRSFNKPYDIGFMNVMDECATRLLKELGANFAYVQSDEITLGWENARPESQHIFDGKFHKINSIAASICSTTFNQQYWTNRLDSQATFDCRSWVLPDRVEAGKVLIWRQMDCMRNAVNMVASSFYSPKQLHGVKHADRIEMVRKKFDWDDVKHYPFQVGRFIKPKSVERTLTLSEIVAVKIPEKLRASLIDKPVVRTEFEKSYPEFETVSNLGKLLFD